MNQNEEQKAVGPDEYPDQCYFCGDYQKPGEVGKKIKVDDDPGDAEVGPEPDIIEVWICGTCSGSRQWMNPDPNVGC